MNPGPTRPGPTRPKQKAKKDNRPSKLALFDISIPCSRYPFDEVLNWMRDHCKRWAFQKEQGESATEYLHFQCRLSLKTKKRLDKFILEMSKVKPGWHISATSNPTYYAGEEFYVTKDDTRVEGPWTDRTDIDLREIDDELQNDNPEWKPWQASVLAMINETPDRRTINVIVDKIGNKGKTFLSDWLSDRKKAERLFPLKDAKDIMRWVYNAETRPCYLLDLPKSLCKRDLAPLYTAIEDVKSGHAFDERYRLRKKRFRSPHIWIFTNMDPDQSLLTRDRWRVWTISNDRLIPYINSKPDPLPREYKHIVLNIIAPQAIPQHEKEVRDLHPTDDTLMVTPNPAYGLSFGSFYSTYTSPLRGSPGDPLPPSDNLR